MFSPIAEHPPTDQHLPEQQQAQGLLIPEKKPIAPVLPVPRQKLPAGSPISDEDDLGEGFACCR